MGKSMKKILLAVAFCISTAQAYAGDFILGAGVARETVTSTARNINIDLYKAKGFYRFDNEMTVGAVLQHGVPSMGAKENRYEGTVGYNPLFGKTRLDFTLGYGVRDREGLSNIQYYYAEVGAMRPLFGKLAGDIQYRYRNSDEISNWQTDMVTVGLSYPVSGVVVRGFYSDQWGDFKSHIVGLNLIKKF